MIEVEAHSLDDERGKLVEQTITADRELSGEAVLDFEVMFLHGKRGMDWILDLGSGVWSGFWNLGTEVRGSGEQSQSTGTKSPRPKWSA